METAADHIAKLKNSLKDLLKQHAALVADHGKQSAELQRSITGRSLAEAELSALREKQLITAFADGTLPAEEKKKFEARINTYLRNIDKCILFLSNKESA